MRGAAGNGAADAVAAPYPETCTGQLREYCGPFCKHGWTQRIIILALFSIFLIFIQILGSAGVDVFALGIRPRTAQGLVGILCAPWVHVSWGHLFGNLIGLWTLGILVLVHGRRMFFLIYMWCATLGGFMTWLMGRPNSNHVGLSGVIFGFFAFLLFAVFWQRPIEVKTVVSLLIAILIYGGSMISGALIPDFAVSWESHLFGFISGGLWALLYFRFLLRNDRFRKFMGLESEENVLPQTERGQMQQQVAGPTPPFDSVIQNAGSQPDRHKWWQPWGRSAAADASGPPFVSDASSPFAHNPTYSYSTPIPLSHAATAPPPYASIANSSTSPQPAAPPSSTPRVAGAVQVPITAMPFDERGMQGNQPSYKNPFLE